MPSRKKEGIFSGMQKNTADEGIVCGELKQFAGRLGKTVLHGVNNWGKYIKKYAAKTLPYCLA